MERQETYGRNNKVSRSVLINKLLQQEAANSSQLEREPAGQGRIHKKKFIPI